MRYVALLRGINVSGKNKVAMPLLRSSLSDIGFKNIVTYINSGNVIFDSELSDVEIKMIFEKLIFDVFGINILVGIYAMNDIEHTLKNAPSWWNADSVDKHNAIFVIPPLKSSDIMNKLNDSSSLGEQIARVDNIVFWTTKDGVLSKTFFSKIMKQKDIYNFITIRNAATTLKLLSFK